MNRKSPNSFETYLSEKAKVTPAQIDVLKHHIKRKSFARGENLLSKGQVCKHSFFVEEGLARCYSISKDGKEHIVQFAPENWFVSDRASLYFNRPTKFIIDAIEDCRLALIDQDFIKLASELSPQFRNYNDFILQNHIRQLQNRINLLLGATAEERYLDFIQLYPDLMLRVPQWMVASYLGITPESLSRVRRNLAREHSDQ